MVMNAMKMEVRLCLFLIECTVQSISPLTVCSPCAAHHPCSQSRGHQEGVLQGGLAGQPARSAGGDGGGGGGGWSRVKHTHLTRREILGKIQALHISLGLLRSEKQTRNFPAHLKTQSCYLQLSLCGIHSLITCFCGFLVYLQHFLMKMNTQITVDWLSFSL